MKSLEQFKIEAVALMKEHLAPRLDRSHFVWGVGSDVVAIFSERHGDEEIQELRRAQQWQALKFDRGFGWVDGPNEYGGSELSTEYLSLFSELESNFAHPDDIFFGIGHGMVGPTLYREGSAEAKEKYLRAIYRGDVICCQLFSEPAAGSDLAATRTTANADGEEWIVNGQKVWTSGAHYSDLGLLLARTNSESEKHRGLTMFLLDMRSPGVEIRPLKQMTGGAHFNEVFLDNVSIPDSNRLGSVNEGWRVAIGTLNRERASLRPGGANATRGFIAFEHLLELARQFEVTSKSSVRQQLAQLYTLRRLSEFTASRLIAENRTGPEFSMCKIYGTEVLRATSELASSILGIRITADTGEWGTYAWSAYILGVPGMRIGGGTEEIQKNILAERVLGLPREPALKLRQSE